MIRLFKENEEFGEYAMFDTEKGSLTEISAAEYEHLAAAVPESEVFQGDSAVHTVFPRRIYFQITRRCNLLCPYCFIKANGEEYDLPLDIIKGIIPYLGKKGLMEVRLTGGEPTIHKGFQEIVEKFYENNVYVSVATNGVWSQEIMDFFISQVNLWLIVSVDGNEFTHNKYRKDTYKKIVQNLHTLRKNNTAIRIRLNTVLTKETIHTIEDVFCLAEQIRAESITFIPLRPQVRDEQIKENMLSSQEFKYAIEQMIVCREKYKVNFTTTIETVYKKQILKDKIFTKKSSCAAGREGMNLDYDITRKKFVVYGCSYSPASDLDADAAIRAPFLAGQIPFGSIEDLEKIWTDDERWTIYRCPQFKSSDCRSCSYYRKACTGSCPIQNIDYSKVQANGEVLNQLKLQMQKNGEWYCYKNFL